MLFFFSVWSFRELQSISSPISNGVLFGGGDDRGRNVRVFCVRKTLDPFKELFFRSAEKSMKNGKMYEIMKNGCDRVLEELDD